LASSPYCAIVVNGCIKAGVTIDIHIPDACRIITQGVRVVYITLFLITCGTVYDGFTIRSVSCTGSGSIGHFVSICEGLRRAKPAPATFTIRCTGHLLPAVHAEVPGKKHL